MINATKLAMGFYHGVLQLSSADRDWRSSINNWTGSMERIGVLYDKIFAMRFLVGDDAITNDPSQPTRELSFLSFVDEPLLRPYVEEIFENAVTTRVDMDNWFLGYGRTLYALNSMNYQNRKDTSLINKIKINQFSPRELIDYFDLNPSEMDKVQKIVLKKSEHPDFNVGEDVALAEINGDFYMTSKIVSPYAYSSLEQMLTKIDENEISGAQYDFLDLYKLYKILTTGTL